jgi:hypothetical protein
MKVYPEWDFITTPYALGIFLRRNKYLLTEGPRSDIE